jgi:hypothetical protein
MKKYLNIFSLLMLVAYGSLTLAAVPLHHHTVEYVDTPQYQSVKVHHGNGCDVCTFASGSYTVSASSEVQTRLVDHSDKPFTLESPKDFSSLFSKEYPRRGPPAFSL